MMNRESIRRDSNGISGMLEEKRLLHFVGIGGSGMSGIAEICLSLGFSVSGSDVQESDTTRRLRDLGATVAIGHRREHLGSAGLVIYSSAVSPDNPELQAARERSVPIIPRAEMLVELIRMAGRSIVVAGAHGKTTTTSLIGTVFSSAGLDPTVVVGGKVNSLGSSARLGKGGVIIAESDESDGSFLLFSPSVAVVTNIDFEHLNYYGSIEVLEKAFTQFLAQVTENGLVVVFREDPRLAGIVHNLPPGNRRICTYGFTGDSEWVARDIAPHEGGIAFDAFYRGKRMGLVQLAIPGRHNVLNALATLAVAGEFQVDFAQTRDALREFTGVQRRFQIYGERDGVLIVDDYGHHPTEIRATIEAARECYPRRLVVLFQPHRYTRTRELYREFTTAFSGADVLLVTDIYPASEPPIPGVNSEWLVDGIRQAGHPSVRYVSGLDDALSRVRENVRPGDLLLTLGAGNVFQVARQMASNHDGREDSGT